MVVTLPTNVGRGGAGTAEPQAVAKSEFEEGKLPMGFLSRQHCLAFAGLTICVVGMVTVMLAAAYKTQVDIQSGVAVQQTDAKVVEKNDTTKLFLDKLTQLETVISEFREIELRNDAKLTKLGESLDSKVQTVQSIPSPAKDYTSVSTIQSRSRSTAPNKWYSQVGQDKWVTHKISLLEPAGARHQFSFLDIGAHDGLRGSNTMALEERGWIGVCIEPIPTTMSKRTCKLVRAVVSDHSGDAVAFKDCTQFGSDNGDGGLSGIGTTLGKHKGEVARCRDEMFYTTTLRDILSTKYTQDIFRKGGRTVIDYTSLDVEGAELDALQGFPWETHCSRLFTIEHNMEEPKRTAIKTFLESKGCEFDVKLAVDDAFVCRCH